MATFTINVDGRDIPAASGQTILQVCRQHGINIPYLCYEPRLSPLGTCRMCTVEVEGSGLTISCSTVAAEGMVVRTNSESVIAARKAKLEQLVADHYGDCLAPCQMTCPAGIDVPGYIALIRRGAHREAVALIRASIPLPAVCGRVCPHPCEAACRRSLVDDPIAINHLKRFAAEQAGQRTTGGDACATLTSPPASASALSAMPTSFPASSTTPPSSRRVAVVGAGPAGLAAAYFLARRGRRVTIFEAQPLPGGMLRYGIPDYRLPKEVLDREIAGIIEPGIDLQTGQRLGKDFTLDSLLNRGFQAIFLALGAGRSIPLGIPGEQLPGVVSGADLLARVASHLPVDVGQRAAVIGGGNTAVDSARTALRLGAREVTVLYRRSRSEMPAIASETAEAEREGVRFIFYTAPLRLEGANGRVQGLICHRTRPGQPDESGRPAPEPVPGSEFSVLVDSVIVAAGQQPDLSWLSGETQTASLRTGRGQTIAVDPDTFSTGVKGVFAGGDLVSGPATAIEAMAAGQKAAAAIHLYLQGVALQKLRQFNSVKGKLDEIDKAEYQGVATAARQPIAESPPESRRGNFNEIVRGYTEGEARAEAARCLQCGCSAVDKCSLRFLATEYAVAQPPPKKDRFHFPVDNSNPFVRRDDNKCVLCGVCARVCRDIVGAAALPSTFRVADASALVPLTRTNCVTCGECTAVCPVGALSPAADLKPSREVTTVCPYCSVGCGVKLGVRGEVVVSARGDPDAIGTNHGLLCFRGRFGYSFVNHPDRLAHPLVRRGGQLVPSSWEEALDLVASELGKYRGDQFAAITSDKILNEDAYALRRFVAGVMGSRNTGSPGYSRHAPGLSVLSDQFGALPTHALSDLGKPACLMVVGADLSVSFPVLWQRMRQAVQNGVYLIAVDPRETEVTRMANLWLRPKPGTDVALMAGLINAMIQENILDGAVAEKHGAAFQALKDAIAGFDPARAEEITGESADRIVEAAYSLAQNRPAMLLYGAGASGRPNASELVKALGNLAVLTSNYGQPGSGVFPLPGQNNSWGCGGAGTATADIIAAALRRDIRAVYVVGSNPAVSCGPRALEALRQLEFLVVQDIFLTETAAAASVVLPAASFAEKDGSFTNLEGRIQAVRRALNPVGESREDWRITAEIARRLGGRGFAWSDAAKIAAEMAADAAATASLAGVAADPRLLPLSLELATPAGEETPPAGNDLYHFNTRTMTGRITDLAAMKKAS